MRYAIFGAEKDELKKLKPGEFSWFYIAPKHLDRANGNSARAAVPITYINYDEQHQLVTDIKDYLNMQEEAKDELLKNKTIASAVLKRMGDESRS